MKIARIISAIAATLAVIALAFALFIVFQRLLIHGSGMIESLGAIEIEEDDGEEALEAETAAPAAATWPPGDDPSWSQETQLTPVDMTADDLAREMESGEKAE